MDNLDRLQRSALMKRVKTFDTSPELAVRRVLHRLGYRYVLRKRDLPGRPDIVFTKRRKVIFVHGCFWHGHDCRLGRLPKSNKEFWAKKINKNRERDKRKILELHTLGWSVFNIWQCELGDMESMAKCLKEFLGETSV